MMNELVQILINELALRYTITYEDNTNMLWVACVNGGVFVFFDDNEIVVTCYDVYDIPVEYTFLYCDGVLENICTVLDSKNV